MMKFLILLLATVAAHAQDHYLEPLAMAPIGSIRGLSVVNDSVLWVSGTQGKAGRSTDGGRNWQWFSIEGCEDVDFRDIEAFSSEKAVLMGIDAPARIYMTTDGGRRWERVYFNETKGMFLDGMDFQDEQEGMIIGDPVGGAFTVLHTRNGGASWETINGPESIYGEGSFAASGTTIRYLQDSTLAMASGGRFFRYNTGKWEVIRFPIPQGKSSEGIFSFAFRDKNEGVAVGGDYITSTGHCIWTKDGGRTWEAPKTPTGGYRSSVEYLGDQQLIATGPDGTDISSDGGMNWTALSNEGYHVARKAKQGKRVYLAGQKGRIAVLREQRPAQ